MPFRFILGSDITTCVIGQPTAEEEEELEELGPASEQLGLSAGSLRAAWSRSRSIKRSLRNQDCFPATAKVLFQAEERNDRGQSISCHWFLLNLAEGKSI